MKILVLSNYGMGLYKFRKELLETLCENNEVTVAMPDGEYTSAIKELGCNFVSFEFNRRGINPFSDIKQILNYKNLIKKLNPDIVLTYTIKPNVYGGLACRLTRKPYIVNVTGLGTSIENGGFVAFVSKTLYRLGLKNAKCVFFQNKENYNKFTNEKIFSGYARIIPGSGVNLEYHSPQPYQNQTDKIRFLFIGRIMKDKGINELLEAIRIVHKHYPYISLDIVGGCDEDYIDKLNADDIKDYVTYHGQKNDVRPFIRDAHCIVLPSYHEGTANVLLESAAAARPVIASRVAGCIETFDEDITGFGCDVKNVDSLVAAMERFIELPWESKEQMGIRGREKMKREYDRNIVINAYLEEINKITD